MDQHSPPSYVVLVCSDVHRRMMTPTLHGDIGTLLMVATSAAMATSQIGACTVGLKGHFQLF